MGDDDASVPCCQDTSAIFRWTRDVRSFKTTNLWLCLKDEPNREDERMFTPLIRQEVCLHTRMQREHSEEEVMAERPYLKNAYRPLLTIHPDNLTATGTWA